MQTTLNIIDVSSLMKTYYKNKFLPDFFCQINGKTIPTKALFGLFSIFKQISLSEYIVFCADSRISKRKQICVEYKKNRKKENEDYYYQIDLGKSVLEKSGFNYLLKEGFEADDLIASVATNYSDDFKKIKIWSNDVDLASLVNPKTEFINIRSKAPNINRDNYEEVLKIPYNTLALYKAMVGDKADEIKGINRFGPKAFDAFISRVKQEYDLEIIRENNLEEEVLKKYLTDEKLITAQKCLNLVLPIKTETRLLDNNIDKEFLIKALEAYEMKSIISNI